MTSYARRLMFLQYGAERVPKSLSLRGGSARLYWEPLVGILIDTADGWILFDTGMSRSTHDAAETEALYARNEAEPGQTRPWHLPPKPPKPERWTWGLSGEPMMTALAAAGLKPWDLTLAIISHLHWDHTGGIPALAAAGVPVAVHRDELAFALSIPTSPETDDWSDPAVRWLQLEDDIEIAPGVQVLATPGHTPGHISLRADLEHTGTWLFAADAADLAQNLLDRTPCGTCATQTAADEDRAKASLNKLLTLAVNTGARLIPGHDQVVFNAARHPSGGHR